MTAVLSPEDRERLEELFDRAADLPAAEQAAFVERECGSNVALRDELQRLLSGLAGVDIVGQVQPVAPLRTGAHIGVYTLRERVGVGGMGEVYAAEQREPVQRRVALKLIKPGMDSREVVARFEAERQALALMNHPNVAQVFDGGATDDGRPYFVMEFVDGEPIVVHCDQHRLSTAERLELFLGVCEGVQHAHQKGLIHRDLKPSNLLVMSQDGGALPKIIDFGVARATTGRLADRTLQTMVGQIVGTLDYMSPEQADPTGVEIDTRSDVYSLGVVLYQLVSGLLPFEHHSDVERPLSEIQRAIRELDPPTPSTRLRKQGGTTAVIAPLHGASTRSLIHELSGDLDWICLKALEKDPARRYQSVAELAQDVRRHLAHEPVLAGRPGALYRARKFVRRHRVGVTAGAIVVVALIAGIYGIVSGRIEAEAQKTEARLNAERAEHSETRRKVLQANQDLEALTAEADRLWPATLDLVPEYDAWLLEAERLVAGLEPNGTEPGYRRRLAELRALALPRTDAERLAERAAHPRSSELAEKITEISTLSTAIDAARTKLGDSVTPAQAEQLAPAEAMLEALGRERDALDAELDERREFAFADALDAEWHDQLATLIAEIEAFADPETGLAEGYSERRGRSIRWRRRHATDVHARTMADTEAQDRWEHARHEIALAMADLNGDGIKEPAYPGLDLKPQAGLLPLGPDPVSGLWEFWCVPTGDEPRRGMDGTWETTGTSGLVFVLIPAGSFFMGAQNDDPEQPNFDQHLVRGGTAEGPVHLVELPESFFLSKFEMTQGQWMRAVGYNPLPWLFEEIPVNYVSWTQCDAAMSRLALRLPTEEQWEYAARAGTQTPWWTGNEEESLGWGANGEGPADNLFDKQLLEAMPITQVMMGGVPVSWSDGQARLAIPGGYRANAFGLYDMLGNVTEWCATHPYSYAGDDSQDPGRMGRGGNNRTGAYTARSAFRQFSSQPDYTEQFLGLRPARAVDL